jgi:isoquinoline 1-oxidoreductase beta subunit
MTDIMPTSSIALSRRSFLVTVGGTSFAVAFGALPETASAAAGGATYQPNAWVTIGTDGIVTLVAPSSEMGQGVMTAMPALIAEDMDADWKKVRVVQAPGDAKNYGNPKFGGAQLTGGSRTTQGYYEKLRLVGCQTRKVLLVNAADTLKVPVGELTTTPGMVVHKASGRKLSYGDIAKTAKVPDPLPAVSTADFKPYAECRYIGKQLARVDVPLKVNGKAKFGIDTQLPNMLYGAVLRAPVQGERPEKIDDVEAKKIKGIVQIVPLAYGVGIVGTTVEGTKKAKEALKVTWSNSAKARSYTSDKALEEYRNIGRDLSKASVEIHKEGDAPAAIAGAAKVISVDYLADHVYHATMEPMNATAVVRGDTVEVWSPTQGQSFIQGFGARMAGTTPDKVIVHTTYLGGGFGRRVEPDFSLDAIQLAKAVPGRPVKVIWSREDDVQNDKYRPMTAQHIQVGLDDSGNILGWRHRLVAESTFARVFPDGFQKSGGRDDSVTEGMEFNYHVPAHLVEFLREPRGVDTGFWRAVGPGYNKFGVECVIDEIAAAKGVDPAALRLELLKAEPRATKVIQTVMQMSDWSKKREGRGLGIAYSDAWGAHCAEVAEVSLDQNSGEIRVHRVWCAVDPGIAIQPENVAAQMESAIVHGASHALYEQINFKNGEVQESNFHDYRVMRMSEAPEVLVTVISTPENAPTGVGEVGLPPVGAAIANAVAQITGGKRLRHYPFLPDRVKEVLKA